MDSATTRSADYDVYIGAWINTLRGHVYGATLTLDRRQGAVLIAFLALYVGLAGQGFWRITSFLLHHAFSSTDMSDGIYNQRQAILRNSESAHMAAWDLFLTSLAWRGKKAQKIYSRLLPVISLSLLISVSFTAAGILSSRVTSNDTNEVLLSGKNCGRTMDDLISEDGFHISSQVPIEFAYWSVKYIEYLTYALHCYRNDKNQLSENCQTYIKPKLPYTKDTNVTCPFGKELCALRFGNVAFDTGYLASDEHLGINSKPRFLIRQTRQCAPLVKEGYSRVEVDADNPTQPYMRYFYHTESNSTSIEPKPYFTWQVPVPANASQSNAWSSKHLLEQSSPTYRLGVINQYPSEQLNYTALPQRFQPDSQISLIFLEASGILYTSPVSDPWFAANQPFWGPEEDGPNGENWYTADSPASTMACATKVFVCNPDLPKDKHCVNVFAHNNTDKRIGFVDTISKLWSNADECASVNGALRFIPSGKGFASDQFYANSGLLPSLLTSFSVMSQLQADAIPSDRWQTEMEYSFQASLASLQAKVVETAIGTLSWNTEEDELCKPHDACRSTCKRQMIKSPRHYSFSVLGVFLVLSLGGLLIVVGFCIERITAYFAKTRLSLRKKPRSVSVKTMYARLEWTATSTLQLQRLAHEGLGFGTWSHANNAIPVTESDEILGVLSMEDEKHTVLTHVSLSPAPTLVETQKSSLEKLSSSSSSQRTVNDSSTLQERSKRDLFRSQARIASEDFSITVLSAAESTERIEIKH